VILSVTFPNLSIIIIIPLPCLKNLHECIDTVMYLFF
jgi:hypothetical protein